MAKNLQKEKIDNNTMIEKLTIIIISALTGEEIGSIIFDRKKENTLNKLFNEFIIKYYNNRLYKSDIKIMNDLLVLYSYYDQSIGNSSNSINSINSYLNEIDSNEIHFSIVFTDEFEYISDIRNTDGDKIYYTDSYQNLSDCKKQEINKLLDKLHNQYDYYSSFSCANFYKLYDHIIITKFIAIILLKKNYPFYFFKMNQLNENFSNDREIVKFAVNQSGTNLQFASIELCADIEIVKIAVSEYGNSLEYASTELRDNKEIVSIAVSQNGYSLRFASMDLCNDREIVTIAVLNNSNSLIFASDNLRDDREIAKIIS